MAKKNGGIANVRIGNYRAPVDTTGTGDFFFPGDQNPKPKPQAPAPQAPKQTRRTDFAYKLEQWSRVNQARALKKLPPLPMPEY